MTTAEQIQETEESEILNLFGEEQDQPEATAPAVEKAPTAPENAPPPPTQQKKGETYAEKMKRTNEEEAKAAATKAKTPKEVEAQEKEDAENAAAMYVFVVDIVNSFLMAWLSLDMDNREVFKLTEKETLKYEEVSAKYFRSLSVGLSPGMAFLIATLYIFGSRVPLVISERKENKAKRAAANAAAATPDKKETVQEPTKQDIAVQHYEQPPAQNQQAQEQATNRREAMRPKTTGRKAPTTKRSGRGSLSVLAKEAKNRVGGNTSEKKGTAERGRFAVNNNGKYIFDAQGNRNKQENQTEQAPAHVLEALNLGKTAAQIKEIVKNHETK